MAQSIDYASFVVVVARAVTAGPGRHGRGRHGDTGATTDRPLDYSIAVCPFYWLPEERLLEREREDGLPLSLYKSRGQLFTSPGATISADQVYRDITTKIAPRFPRLRVDRLRSGVRA